MNAPPKKRGRPCLTLEEKERRKQENKRLQRLPRKNETKKSARPQKTPVRPQKTKKTPGVITLEDLELEEMSHAALTEPEEAAESNPSQSASPERNPVAEEVKEAAAEEYLEELIGLIRAVAREEAKIACSTAARRPVQRIESNENSSWTWTSLLGQAAALAAPMILPPLAQVGAELIMAPRSEDQQKNQVAAPSPAPAPSGPSSAASLTVPFSRVGFTSDDITSVRAVSP